MARPNHSFEKRKREMEKKQKKEEKRQRKLDRAAGIETDDHNTDTFEDAPAKSDENE